MPHQRVDLTEGNLLKGILTLAWPVIVANLLQTAYNIVDAFWLGKLGKEAFSAPTIAWPVIFTGISFAFGISVAANSLVAQYAGSGDKRSAELMSAQAMVLSILISSVLIVVGLFFSKPILALMGAKDEILEMSSTYLQIILLGSPLLFAMFAGVGALRGWGNSKIAMHFTIISVALNVVLDPLMIFGIGFPRMGVAGAALATVVSRSIAAIYGFYVLLSGRVGMKIHWDDFAPRWDFMKKVFVVGLPVGFGNSVTSLGFAFIMGVVARFGSVVVSAYGVGNRIISVITMFSGGIAAAIASAVGQSLGAGKPERAVSAVKLGSLVNFTTVTIFCVFTFFFGKYLTRFFINDPEVVEMGEIFFRLVSFSVPFFATMQTVLAALDGSGRTVKSTMVNVVRLWGVRVPMVLYMAKAFGFAGIFYAMIVSNIAALLLALSVVIFSKWQEKII